MTALFEADLRAKVEALDSPLSETVRVSRWVRRADVLDLIDGADL